MTHMLVNGETRFGKSYFLQHGARSKIKKKRGFTWLDGGGDGVEDVLPYAVAEDCLDRIEYIELTPHSSFRLNPGKPQDVSEQEYRPWLRKRVEDTGTAIIRPHLEFDFHNMPMLQRVLHNVLYVCLILVCGTCLGVGKALEVLRFDNPEWEPDWNTKFKPQIDELNRIEPEVVYDLYDIMYQSRSARRNEILSTVNRLRTFLSPLVRTVFADGPTLDIHKIVREERVLLAKINPSRFFTLDQSIAIGGLLMNEVLDACETASRFERVDHTLIIDEAEPYLGDDLSLALARSRKWGLSIWLGLQNLYLED